MNGLELADAPQTALVVSIARRSRFLSRTNEAATGLDMRMLKTPVEGKFIDLRTVSAKLSREQRWSLGDAVPPTSTASFFGQPSAPRQRRLPSSRGRCSAISIQTNPLSL